MRQVRFSKTRMPFAVPAKIVALILVVAACVSYGANDDDELINIPKVSNGITGPLLNRLQDIGNRAGFEIGNGRTLIKNEPGKYQMKIYDKWEAGKADTLTEIISPLYEGVPRARLQINVEGELKDVQSLEDLQAIYEAKRSEKWVRTALGSLQGVQMDTIGENGVHEVQVRLFRAPGEVLVIKMDGKPGTQELTPFDKAVNALTTFKGNVPN